MLAPPACSGTWAIHNAIICRAHMTFCSKMFIIIASLRVCYFLEMLSLRMWFVSCEFQWQSAFIECVKQRERSRDVWLWVCACVYSIAHAIQTICLLVSINFNCCRSFSLFARSLQYQIWVNNVRVHIGVTCACEWVCECKVYSYTYFTYQENCCCCCFFHSFLDLSHCLRVRTLFFHLWLYSFSSVVTIGVLRI